MNLALVSHVNGDGDLLEAWFKYYLRLGVSSFRLIVHGSREENEQLYSLRDSYPLIIEDAYTGPFDSEEKKRRLNSLLGRMRGQWLMLADSDEFVELPYRTISATILILRLIRRNALFAPMVQHLTIDGSLETPPLIENPFSTFPLCSVDLYQRMGVSASIKKYPLFYNSDRSALRDGGNHSSPSDRPTSILLGVTHHFKFRRSVLQRLNTRIQSCHPWRHESLQFQEFIEDHSRRLPREGTFEYSRRELFRRGLLLRPTFTAGLRHVWRKNSLGVSPR